MDIRESERCTVHYQPFAGGTTNTMASEVIQRNPDETTVFKTVSDSKRLHGGIRYEPEDKSKKLTMSERLKHDKHISPVKINGTIRWENHFEIHISTAGWRTASDLGKVRLNIPGIEGMKTATNHKGTTAIIKFEDSQDLKFSAWYNRKENTPHISVKNHPKLDTAEEIVYDNLYWFHDAYPFSGTSVGIRLGFPSTLKYRGLNFKGDKLEFDEHRVSREYGEARTKNDAVQL